MIGIPGYVLEEKDRSDAGEEVSYSSSESWVTKPPSRTDPSSPPSDAESRSGPRRDSRRRANLAWQQIGNSLPTTSLTHRPRTSTMRDSAHTCRVREILQQKPRLVAQGSSASGRRRNNWRKSCAPLPFAVESRCMSRLSDSETADFRGDTGCENDIKDLLRAAEAAASGSST